MVTYLSALMTQQVIVETFQGNGASGVVYAAPVTVRAFVDDGLVSAKESGGSEVVAKTAVFCDLSWADTFTVGSRVTANGEDHTVVSVKRRDGAPILSGVRHLEVTLS